MTFERVYCDVIFCKTSDVHVLVVLHAYRHVLINLH